MSRTQSERESSVFRKPTAPPPERTAVRRGPEARGDRSLTIPPSVASSLSRTVREQLAYLTPDQQRAFLWRYRAQAKSPLIALLFLPLGWHYLYLRKRGLQPWRCTIADGALGLWAALGEQEPDLAEQRCWNHKLVNVLDALPTKHQAAASALLRAMPYAESQAACEALRDQFTARYQALAPKAVERLHDDWERLVTFYQFPQEHWVHLRTTNIVESPFATVRLRTTAAKRFKKVENATAVIWKLLQVAESSFRRLKGAELLPAAYAGARYVDGVKQVTRTPQRMAA